MTPREEPNGEESALLENRPPRGHPLLAWLLIAVIVTAIVVVQFLRAETNEAKKAAEKPGGIDVTEVQARYLVGVPQIIPVPKQPLAAEVKALYTGSYRQRLRVAVLAGELEGPKPALTWLETLRNDDEVPRPISKEDGRLTDLLELLYRGYEKKLDPVVLKPDDREFLRAELGWFGELALAPEGGPDVKVRTAALLPATKVALAILGSVAGACGGILVGIVVLILVLIAMFGAHARRGFSAGSPYGAIYAETFALWLLVFVGLQVAGFLLPPDRSQLFRGALLTLSSLAVLGWPVLRGVPWKQVRQEVGLSFFGQPLRQVLSGPVCYLASLPLLLLGLLGMMLIVLVRKMLSPDGGGGLAGGEGMHPIVRYFADADGWVMFQIFFAACFVAPLVEEVFFRGVLYRHLREATKGAGFGWSLLLSGLLASFIFAVIHPQGLIGVPVLMSLALGFTLTREWRGSLVPCMIAHGLSNGLVMLLAVNLFGK